MSGEQWVCFACLPRGVWGGDFVSGEQWVCFACLPRGVWGSSPRKVLRKYKCPEIDSGGIWQPSIY